MKTVEVAAALVVRQGKLLITQRLPGTHLAGRWEFPGGKRRPDESREECLLRELQEELGIEVEVETLVESILHHYPEKSVHLFFYKCRWLRHEPDKIGCADFRWIGPADFSRYEFPAADARLLKRLRSEPGLWI